MVCSTRRGAVLVVAVIVGASFGGVASARAADEPANLPKAFIDGTGPGWRALGEDDFTAVNCDPDTFTWKNGALKISGKPVGVIRSKRPFTNLELVARWRHLQPGGNSGIFLWASEDALNVLKPDQLPKVGIEVQVLDPQAAEIYEKKTGNKGDGTIFTGHGDVFPVEKSNMKPFSPVALGGKRSLPRKRLTKGVGEWNHYYVRAINGEVRLWVNGEEVSGGTECDPRSGFLCLESEGAPAEFEDLRIRELP